jgi:indolepyruvate ferredoxin oxidoreductase alpha subunit
MGLDCPSGVALDETIPPRPPVMCAGCPHRGLFYTLAKKKLTVMGDIGCYTLGAVAPLDVIDTTVCMGASISTLHGIEKAMGKEFRNNWVAVIGDSTFLHTGINSLINSVYNKSTGTVIILDNRTTGMTGHQEHSATGKTLKGDDTYAINLKDLCLAVGVPVVLEIDAFDVETLEKEIKKSVNGDVLTVIIAKSPCALLKGQKFPNRCEIDKDACKKCKACLRIGCPAISMRDGVVTIDETMCNGCGLCKNYCKFNAIKVVAR